MTSQTVTVQVNGDTTVEPNETFNVNLSSATGNATITDTQGVGTIVNDDARRPTVTALSPTHGAAAGGNTVTLTGTDLTGTTAVHFGANAATGGHRRQRDHGHGRRPGGHRAGARSTSRRRRRGATSSNGRHRQRRYT